MEILDRLHVLRRVEHESTVAVIEALVECERTMAYLRRGHAKLWNFLVDELRYSHGAASRRHRAMRCALKFPVVLDLLRAQRVSLCSLSMVESLLDEIDDPQALLDRIDGKSQPEVKRVVAEARPVPPRGERVRREFVKKSAQEERDLFSGPAPVEPTAAPVEERITVTLSLTPEEYASLERARAIASRRPGAVPTVTQTVVAALDSYVKDRAPRARAKKPRRERATPRRTRHIPAAVRDDVLLRDGERCTFVGSNGKRCNATHALQIDHIVPFAHGGTHDPQNLRVVCGAHNRMLAEEVFGVRGRRE